MEGAVQHITRVSTVKPAAAAAGLLWWGGRKVAPLLLLNVLVAICLLLDVAGMGGCGGKLQQQLHRSQHTPAH